ncbi:MAG TPA: oligoendopeptidase, partial [Bacillota bacterium]|nr:oligoendopeptidase [Bacillota bacterium]
MKYQNTWDLEAIFAGGTRSEDLQKKVKSVEVEVGEFKDLLDAWNPEDNSPEPLKALLDKLDSIEKGLIQGYAFVRMSLDANTKDDYGPVVLGQIMMIKTALDNYQTVFIKKMVAVEDRLWADLLEDPTLKEVAFALNEARDQGKRLLSEEEEKIINELNRDGITGWSQIYDTVVSTMTIPFTGKDGTTVEYSVGQAMNRMYGDPDPEVRRQLFENWEKAWEKNAPIFADILNHLSGYRLTLQKLHNREHYLEEPLEINRMSKETLDAMWSAVA